MRKILLNIHLVVGLVAAAFLLILGGTGAVLVFENELDHTINSKLMKVQPTGERLSYNALCKKLEESFPGAKVGSFTISTDDTVAMSASLRGGTNKGGVFLNQYTGEVLGNTSEKNPIMSKVHQFHTNLLAGPKGKTVTLWGAILLLVLSITGVILWWPQKLFKMSRGKSGSRVNFELHSVLGFYSSVFMLLFGLTGIVVHFDDEAQKWINRISGAPETAPAGKPAVPPQGSKPLSADELAQAALKLVPGARVTAIMGFGLPKTSVRIVMKYPEDGTPLGRTNLLLDSTTGEVLSMQTSRTGPLGLKIAKLWNREIHTGDLFGWPTRILAALMSIALPLLTITGPLIWWGRIRRKQTAQT